MASKNASSSSGNGNTPPDDTTSTDAQQTLAEPPTDTGSTNGTAGAAKAASEADTASKDTPDENSEPTSDENTEEGAESETPDVPQVVTDENGQRVLMPDGSVVTTRQHNFPMTNAEQATFEETHTGDQPRYAFVPGDASYSPYSDPAVPDSHRAQTIEREIASYAERVLTDAKAYVSPTWHSLKGLFEEELHHAIETGIASGKVRL